MADAEVLKQTLPALSAAAPSMAARLLALSQEAAATQAAVDDFRQRMAEREAEGATLFAQLEAALAALRGSAAAAELDTHDPGALLDDPALSFEDKLFLFGRALVERQEQALADMAAAWRGHLESQRAALGEALSEHPQRLGQLQSDLEGALETTVVEAAGLQGTVSAARDAVVAQADGIGATLDQHRLQSAHDLDQMKKDVTTLEESFLDRIAQAREAVRRDAGRMATEAEGRVKDVEEALSRSLEELARGLDAMSDRLRQATEETADVRRELLPLFDDIDSRLAPLRQAIESVREAAHSVGIPF